MASPSASRNPRSPERATAAYDQQHSATGMAHYYAPAPESSSRRYSSGGHRDVPMNGTSASPVRSPTSSRPAGSYFYDRERTHPAANEHSTSPNVNSSSWNHSTWSSAANYPENNTTGGGSGNSYPSSAEPERRRYPSAPTTGAAPIASSPSTASDPHHYHHHLHHHHHHHPQPSRYDQDPLRSPARDYEGRTRRHSNSGSPPRMSPPTKHAPIPAPQTEDQYAAPRSGAMSISSLLTTETPASPNRPSNVLPTASSSRPQRRKSSMEHLLPPAPVPLPSANKKRKREGEVDERTANGNGNGKLPKIKFRSSAMDSMTEDESDGLDDSEFQAEHEKYLQDAEARDQVLHEAEERRQVAVRSRIDYNVIHRLEARMKQSRRKASQQHYEAAMSKVLREESRRKEEAREAKRNKKRKLLPVVEDPVVKIDRRKRPKPKKPAEETGEGRHFVIKLKGVGTGADVSMEELVDEEDGDVVELQKMHSFLAGRPTPRYLPPLPQLRPGETMSASGLRAYDRLAKSAEKRFDIFISAIWKDIAKRDVPKAYRQMDLSLKAKQSNAKKTVQLASKEARRWQARSTKNSKEMQIKAKKAMREMLVFWRKNEREERDQRKRAEKEAIDRAKKEEQDREQKRQQRKLNFLITQTELYSHFVGKKVGAGQDETDTPTNGEGTSQPSPIPSGDGVDLPSRFDELDFDAEDDEALRAAAARSAQNAVQLAQDKAKDFDVATGRKDKDIEMKDIDIDGEDMNFRNPTGMNEIEQIDQPKMLKCQLKEYQLKGLNWLVNLYEQGINGILADEMGLGKTVQSISVMAYLAETYNVWGPFLVIAPSSTLHNWQQELTKFVPDIKALPYWGNAKDRKVLRKFWNRKHVTYEKSAPFHVLITSYQLVVQDEKYFQKIKWQYMILDEAQAIKSSSSSRWKILLGLHCRNRLLLTGTPIQNTMQELWALLHFIMPTLFDSHEEFSDWFSKDIEAHSQGASSKLSGPQLRRLHMILKPFMLRRNKRDVQSELPAKVELDVYCNLSYRQRAFYKTLRDRISIGDLLERALSGEAKGDESLMNLVMQFRKVCNHPDLFERADVRSPLSFSSFGTTPNIAREGRVLSLAYTTRNRIKYDVPKLMYRHGGMLDVPSEDSDAGARRRLLASLLNIWQPDYVESSAVQKGSAFSFLQFVDASASDLLQAFKANDISFAAADVEKRRHRETVDAVYGEFRTTSMLLVPETTSRFPLKDVTNEKVMAHLCNVARDSFREDRFHIMDPMYDTRVVAPPIDINCSDRTFFVEQRDVLFDSKSRRALFGILPLEDSKLDEAGETFDLGAIPPHGLLGPAVLEKSGYSRIRVPEMHRFVTDSGKLATLDKLLGELKAGGHRVLLYFQMTRMMDLIEEYLTYRQYKYLRLDGSSKIGDRRDMVMDWQTRPDLFVFVLSTRAGGLGINLTAADTVIFYDSDWNPTVDSQAMDRAHRLGQTKQVTVYRMITRNSIEERILMRAKQKEEVQRVVISGQVINTEIDFNKGNSREVVSWLLTDEELQQQQQIIDERREAEEAEAAKTGNKKRRGGKKKVLGVASLDNPSRTLEDMYHEGEGNFEDVSARASGTVTPASGIESGPSMKKARSRAGETHKAAVKRSHKRRAAEQASQHLDGENGDIEMTDV